MAKAKASVTARFDPDPNHYLLTEVEFDRLCEVAKIPEKENVFFLLGLFIPSAINTWTIIPTSVQTATLGFVLNFIVAVITVLMVLFQARGWYAKRKAFRNFVNDLKERPEGKLAFSAPQERVYVGSTQGEG